MPGKFMTDATGKRVWVEDGQSIWQADGQPADYGSPHGKALSGDQYAGGGGFQMGGGKGATPGGPSGYGTLPMDGYLPNYATNSEAARLMWLQANQPNHISAAHVDPIKIDRTASDAARAQQYAMLAALDTHAAGGGPSVADSLAADSRNAATRAAMAARPGALRAAIGASSNAYGQSALSGAAMKASEQRNAWKALGGATAGVRAADIGANMDQANLSHSIALANSGFGTSASVANMNADLAGLANKTAAAGAFGDLVNSNTDARLQRRAYNVQGEQLNRQARQMSKDRDDKQTAETVSTVGKMFAMASDERTKTNVKPSDRELRAWLTALHPVSYEYKDPTIEGASPGRKVGVMAQDLAATKLGKRAVHQSPQGHLMVNYDELAPAQLAGLALLNERVDDIEEKLSAKYRALGGGK